MKALEKFAGKLAEHIFRYTDSSSFVGQRLLAADFPDKVLELAADALATLASETKSTILKAENVLFVLNEVECQSFEERARAHSAHQAGLSYCVNVRDRGETAVFFVRRSLMPFVDESLKEKGSVRLSNLRITPGRILSATLDEYINEARKLEEDPREWENVRSRVFERCRRLFLDERSEMLCFDMMDDFFSLPAEEAFGPRGYKALGLAPVEGEPEASVAKNIQEIDRLRQSLASPSKRISYLSEHKEYDPEIYRDFEKYLDNQKWRVPLETVAGGQEYREFFREWPDTCTLAFLECASKGSARLDFTNIKGGSGRKFEPFGTFLIIDENELQLEWKSSNLDGCPGEIAVDGRARIPIPALDSDEAGPVSADHLSIPVCEQCELKVRPEQPSDRRRLQKGCRNSVKIVRLDYNQDQALILFGRSQMVIVKDDDKELTISITLPPSMTATINSLLFKGFQPAGPVNIKDEDTGEDLASISMEEGESVFLRVDWEDKPEPTLLEVICEEEAPDAAKPVNSLITAIQDARGKLERFSEEGIMLEEEWSTYPHFSIICKDIPDFTVPYEARRSWSHELLPKILEKPDILGPRSVLISGGKIEMSAELLDTRDGIPWSKPWEDSTVEAFVESRSNLFSIWRETEVPIPFTRLSSFQDAIIKYAKDYYDILKRFRDKHDSYKQSLSFFSLIDAFYSTGASRLPVDGKATEADLNRGIYLLSPTHPVRLLWLLRREKLALGLFQSASHRQVLKLVDALKGLGFPANVVLPNEAVLYNTANPEDSFWGVYVPENMPFDDAISALSNLLPTLKNGFDNPLVPDAAKVHSALDYSHRVLPYRHTLRVGYSNPGSAQCLREALKNVKKAKGDEKDLHHALFNKETTRFRVNLIGPTHEKLGGSFAEVIREEQREDLPQKLEIQSTENDETDLRYTDLSFADDITNRNPGALLPINRCPSVLPLKGLICPLISRSSLLEDATGETLFASPHPVPSIESLPDEPSEISSEYLSSVLNHLYQTLFREPKADAPFYDKIVRAFKVEYRQDTLSRVRTLQNTTNFLFTLDTNADLAMYEAMAAAGESIIIDFDPAYHNPIAKVFSRTSHNYVITTSRHSPVKKKLKSELIPILGDGAERLEGATDRLFSTLNGLSGKLLKEMLQRPTDVKGTIGCGLSSLLVRRIVGQRLSKGEKKEEKIASVLIPIDDHFARWLKLSGRGRRTGQGRRSDLLFATVYMPQESDRIQVWLRILEAKLGYHGVDVSPTAYAQIRNTWETICRWLRLEPSSSDASLGKFECMSGPESLFRVLDLASILDFYLRRTARLMPELLVGFENDEGIENFCNQAYMSLVQGKGEFLFDLRGPAPSRERLANGEGIIAGHILHFDPESDADQPFEERGVSPSVLYRVIGRQTCLRLLTGE